MFTQLKKLAATTYMSDMLFQLYSLGEGCVTLSSNIMNQIRK